MASHRTQPSLPGVIDASRRAMVGLGEGGLLLRRVASAIAPSLLAAVKDMAASSSFRRMATPRGSMAAVGWTADKAEYRYSAVDPITGRPWPEMPAVFRNLAARAAAAAGLAEFEPDSFG